MSSAHKYLLRLFFDPGSGTCLWAGNSTTEKAYGYAIDIDSLPISAELAGRIHQLVRSYDEAIDWNNPTGPFLFSQGERKKFNNEAGNIYNQLCKSLGEQFKVINEFDPLPEQSRPLK